MRAAGIVFYTLGRDEPTETHGSEGQLNNTLCPASGYALNAPPRPGQSIKEREKSGLLDLNQRLKQLSSKYTLSACVSSMLMYGVLSYDFVCVSCDCVCLEYTALPNANTAGGNAQ